MTYNLELKFISGVAINASADYNWLQKPKLQKSKPEKGKYQEEMDHIFSTDAPTLNKLIHTYLSQNTTN